MNRNSLPPRSSGSSRRRRDRSRYVDAFGGIDVWSRPALRSDPRGRIEDGRRVWITGCRSGWVRIREPLPPPGRGAARTGGTACGWVVGDLLSVSRIRDSGRNDLVRIFHDRVMVKVCVQGPTR